MLHLLNRLVPLLLVAVTLSGCVDNDPADTTTPIDPVSAPVHEIDGHYDHTFVGETGTQLYVDYFLPETSGPVPVILTFTPYQNPAPGEASDGGEGSPDLADPAYNSFLVDHFVPRGYAVAFADVRGNHRAGGCIDQTGPEQWQDGVDYVTWLGTQPWSNGNVGMYGASYDGETQFTTAMMAPEHLKTIVPVASVSNQYEWNFYNGVPYEMQPTLGMGAYFAGSATPSLDPEDALLYPEKLECQDEAMLAGLDFSGDRTDFWAERDYRPMAANITASVLHVHGLADWNVRPIHIDPLFNDIDAEKRGLFGQWRHAYPDREDWLWILTAWYDHFLKDANTGILDILPPVLVEDDREQWWGIDAFPPRDPDWMVLGLHADGTLAPGAGTGEVLIQDLPEEALTGASPGTVAGARETATGMPASHTWRFTTKTDLHLMGRPYVAFNATSSDDTHWVAELAVEGEQCILNDRGQAICQNAGYQDTRHRDGWDQPQETSDDTPYHLRIDMFPQADVIPAGSTVTLTLRNNNADVQQDDNGAVSTIDLATAWLHLPMQVGGEPLPHDALPGEPADARDL